MALFRINRKIKTPEIVIGVIVFWGPLLTFSQPSYKTVGDYLRYLSKQELPQNCRLKITSETPMKIQLVSSSGKLGSVEVEVKDESVLFNNSDTSKLDINPSGYVLLRFIEKTNSALSWSRNDTRILKVKSNKNLITGISLDVLNCELNSEDSAENTTKPISTESHSFSR